MASILVLDDVLDSAVMIERILARRGYEVHVFTDEDEALRFAGMNRPDLAIVDMKLRKMDGVEVLTELRRRWPELAVIILTGYPTAESVRQVMARGALAYCIKPIDKTELEQTVARGLRGGAAPPE